MPPHDHTGASSSQAGTGFPSARDIYSKDADLAHLLYISVRPTFDLADYTVTSSVDDAEACQIEFGEPAWPSYAAAAYNDISHAIDDALAIRRVYPHLKLWYDGQEIQAEFSDWISFVQMFAEVDETWEAVGAVAAGQLSPQDPTVVAAMRHNSLIATAIARVTP